MQGRSRYVLFAAAFAAAALFAAPSYAAHHNRGHGHGIFSGHSHHGGGHSSGHRSRGFLGGIFGGHHNSRSAHRSLHRPAMRSFSHRVHRPEFRHGFNRGAIRNHNNHAFYPNNRRFHANNGGGRSLHRPGFNRGHGSMARNGFRPFRHGNFRHLSSQGRFAWSHGNWHHGWHHGRFGWWWLVSGIWYFYTAPLYPFPELISDIAYGADGYGGGYGYNDGGYNDGSYSDQSYDDQYDDSEGDYEDDESGY